MITKLSARQYLILSLLAISMTIFGFTSYGWSQQRGTRTAAAQATEVANPCRLNPPESTACFKYRIDKLEASVTSLEQRFTQLEQRQNQLSQDQRPGDGKADSFDDLWSEIKTIKKRLNMN